MWDQGGQPWPQWPLSQQQWMQSFQHQQDPGQWMMHSFMNINMHLLVFLHIYWMHDSDGQQVSLTHVTCISNQGVYFWLCPGQVDWAALAQAWIAQKESTGPEPPTIQPNGQDLPGLEPVAPSNHGAFQGDPGFGRIWQPGTPLTSSQHFFFISTTFFVFYLICVRTNKLPPLQLFKHCNIVRWWCLYTTCLVINRMGNA